MRTAAARSGQLFLKARCRFTLALPCFNDAPTAAQERLHTKDVFVVAPLLAIASKALCYKRYLSFFVAFRPGTTQVTQYLLLFDMALLACFRAQLRTSAV